MPRASALVGDGAGPAAAGTTRAAGWAALGGALYFLGFVGFGAWPLLGVFLVPLWHALESARSRGWATAAALGGVFGAVAFAGGHLWLWRLVDVFLDGRWGLGGLLWLGYGAWFALGTAVYAALYHVLRRRRRSVALAGIAPWVAVEWFWPEIFPVRAGSGLVLAPPLVQIAELGGPLLLSAFVAAIDAVAWETLRWLRGARARPTAAWLAGAALLAGNLAFGALRSGAVARAVEAAPAIRVGLVQADLGVLEKRTQGVIGHRRYLEQTRALLAEGPLDLVVWPETAYARGLRRPLPIAGDAIRDDIDVPLLFGGPSVEERGGRRVRFNSALLVDADGLVRTAYDKNWLIPLAETLPFRALWPGNAEWLPHVQAFAASDAVPPLRLGPWRISTPICYEAVRPEFVRRMVREARPHWLVSLANDAWFGDSQEPWIHLALARLRAVEHRRFLVRATNSGVSAVIDPLGRVVGRTALGARENLRATIHPLEIGTVYTRLGDWPGPLAIAVCALGLLRDRRRSAHAG